MITGIRTQATNSATVGVYSAGLSTAIPLMTVPTGKTFVLTDLVVGFTLTDNLTAGNQLPGIGLTDLDHAGNTAPTQTQIKFMKKAPLQGGDGINTMVVNNVIVTNLENGPEFSTCLAITNLCSVSIPTFSVFAGGYLK